MVSAEAGSEQWKPGVAYAACSATLLARHATCLMGLTSQHLYLIVKDTETQRWQKAQDRTVNK